MMKSSTEFTLTFAEFAQLINLEPRQAIEIALSKGIMYTTSQRLDQQDMEEAKQILT